MKIRFQCKCGKILVAPASMAGKQVKCPSCGRNLEVTPSGIETGISGPSVETIAGTSKLSQTSNPSSDFANPPKQAESPTDHSVGNTILPFEPSKPQGRLQAMNKSNSPCMPNAVPTRREKKKLPFTRAIATISSIAAIAFVVGMIFLNSPRTQTSLGTTKNSTERTGQTNIGGERRNDKSKESELAKTIEAAKLFIEAGQVDEARRLLTDAGKSSQASETDKVLVRALLAKANAIEKESQPKQVNGTPDQKSPAIDAPMNEPQTEPQPTASASSSKEKAPLVSNVSSLDLPGLIDQVQPSIVVITTGDGLGSGFVVNDGLVVTNRHVLEGARKAKVQFRDGQTYDVEGIVFNGGELDLCIIRCKGLTGSNSTALKIASDSLRQGEGLFTFGAPKGLEFSVSEGIVSANRWIDDTAYVQTTAPISPGNSGGPLLSSKDGSLVGINTWYRADGQNLNFAISSSHLKDALTKLKDQPEPLNIGEGEYKTSLNNQTSDPSCSQILKAEWVKRTKSKQDSFQSRVQELRELVSRAASDGEKCALTVSLEKLLHEQRTVGSSIKLYPPNIDLSETRSLRVGSFGFVQNRLEIIQILSDWTCLVDVDDNVFLLEDFPTRDSTSDTVLSARNGPVIYIAGTYSYTNRMGSNKTVFRIQPAWDLEKVSEANRREQEDLRIRSTKQLDEAVKAALTRTWTSSNFTKEAFFKTSYGVGGKFIALLVGKDGAEMKVPIEVLSEEDQRWIKDYNTHAKPL